MRILLIVTTLRPQSGWGTFGRNTVRGLQARGHTVSVLVHEKTNEELCEQDVSLPDPLTLLCSPVAWIKTAFAIRRAARRFRPDVIHILVEPYALAMPLCRWIMKRVPWVMSLNGTYSVLPLYSGSTHRLLCRAYRSADHILSPSAYTAQRALKAIGERCGAEAAAQVKGKITQFRLGIESTPSPSAAHRGDAKNILYVGGIKPRKGIAEILEGCAAFRERSTVPFHLHLVGTYPDDAYRQELQSLIGKRNLQKNVTFHGHIDEEKLGELYAKADLFIMLSKSFGHHFEGFGLVFLEANTRGIPAIGSKNSGCAEAIDEGVSGFSVDHADAGMIAQRMQWILEENRISPDACRHWAGKHSVEQQAHACETTYKNVLSGQKEARMQ